MVSSGLGGKDASAVASQGSVLRKDQGAAASTARTDRGGSSKALQIPLQDQTPLPRDMQRYQKQSLSSYSYGAANVIGSMVQKEAGRESGGKGNRPPLVERAERDRPAEGVAIEEGGQGANIQTYNLYHQKAGSKIF